MKKMLTAAAALVAGTGVATAIFATTTETDLQPDAKVIASEVARSLITGIILGSNVGPYQSTLVPAHIESRVTASGMASAPTADRYSVASE
jgi:hypothetical protein